MNQNLSLSEKIEHMREVCSKLSKPASVRLCSSYITGIPAVAAFSARRDNDPIEKKVIYNTIFVYADGSMDCGLDEGLTRRVLEEVKYDQNGVPSKCDKLAEWVDFYYRGKPGKNDSIKSTGTVYQPPEKPKLTKKFRVTDIDLSRHIGNLNHLASLYGTAAPWKRKFRKQVNKRLVELKLNLTEMHEYFQRVKKIDQVYRAIVFPNLPIELQSEVRYSSRAMRKFKPSNNWTNLKAYVPREPKRGHKRSACKGGKCDLK